MYVYNQGGAVIAEEHETEIEPPIVNLQAFVVEGVFDPEPIELADRGTAFDFEDAPNQVVLELSGDNPDGLGVGGAFGRISEFLTGAFYNQQYGYIFGDIDLSADDIVRVHGGKTVFDGVINPRQDTAFNGELTIEEDGQLVLIQNANQGASAAFVNEFNLNETGTLVLELTPEDTDADPSKTPTVQANTVNLNGGTIFAMYTPGLYEDELRYEDVVRDEQGDPLVGEFEVDDNSALLVTEVDLDQLDQGEVDLVVTRQEFGEVAGLTKNQQNVGDAIENIYDDLLLDSDFAQNVAQLFSLNDEDYPAFLNQLTGAEYAQYLQSVLWSTRVLNRTITERMECDAAYAAGAMANVNGMQVRPTADLAPAVLGCFTPGTGHVWGRAFGSWNSHDGDQNAPGYDEQQYGFTVGADYAFTESFYAGLAGGWLNSEMDFDGFGGRSGASIDYDGWQIAGYGGYDNRVWYLRGILGYAEYTAEAHRNIIVGISEVDPAGDPDSNVLSFYGEAGYRWEFATNSTVTPFVGVNVAHAEIDGFTERDPQDTNWHLRVRDAEGDSVATLLGARFNGNWDMGGGIFRPEVMVAWQHEFEDTVQSVDMAFVEAPNGGNFTAFSAETNENSLVVGVGGTFAVTNALEFGIKYDGLFNQDYNSQSVIGRVGYKF